MFTSFRQRLLFCFILIISVNFIVLSLTHFHMIARNNILRSTNLVEAVYVLLLKDEIARQDFFSMDVHNDEFFRTAKSESLSRHARLNDSIDTTLDMAIRSFSALPYTLDDPLMRAEDGLKQNEALFDSITALTLRRGYKDYSVEGSMRRHIHRLEKSGSISNDKILSLRRNEKDYIIRNETIYVDKLNALVDEFLKTSLGLKGDSTAAHLVAYRDDFNAIVALDAKIGLKDNSGLKKKLDDKSNELEASFTHIVQEAKTKQERLFYDLNIIYFVIAIVLIVGSIFASFIISRKITRPLSDLTAFITRFIDSEFTVEEKTPDVRSKDEIGKLTANFTLLKNEVISHLKFFKRKVDERTAELYAVNQKLIETNEANSRFVPKEFLEHLGRTSVTDISAGDQVAGEMTILFSDIRSFTQISETLSPQDNFDFINAYLKEIVPVIREHNGFIDKFIGDTVMAIFPSSPDDAIKASLGFSAAVARFNEHLHQKGIPPIAIGTGIHTGHVVLGTIGHAHRLETTVISDAVNIASRVEGLTKYYHAGIIVSESTLSQASQLRSFTFRFLDDVRVKGKLKSVRVYEILDPVVDALKITYLPEYERALNLIKERKFDNAVDILQQIIENNPNDKTVDTLLQRSKRIMESGMAEDWSGIEIMQSK